MVDVSMSATGPIVQSFTAHFIQRWNFVKKDKYEFNARYPILPPAFGTTEAVGRLGRQLNQQLQLGTKRKDIPQGIHMQLCRSATKWSQGVEHEKSIQNAYIELITHSTRMSYRPVLPANCRFHLHRESILQ
jgi:phospholipase D1/2